MFIIYFAEIVAYCHPIPKLNLMTFGRQCQVGDKLRSVFDPLRVAPERLAAKALYMSLKLLPFLIRFLLIHGSMLSSVRIE
jgi:hypothetical protein